MSTLDIIVVIANMVMACMACIVNVIAARRLGHNKPMQKLAYVIASLAAGYVLAYVILLSNTSHLNEWSSVMRAIALFVWPIVWMGYAVLIVNVLKGVQSISRELGKVA